MGVGEIRTLRRAFVVFWRFGSPRFLGVHLALLVALRSFLGSPGWTDVAVVGTVAIYWPFQEWVLHAYVLHFRPRRVLGRTVDPLPARVHRAHHREPWRLGHVFLPVKSLLVLAPLFALLWSAAMPSWPLALTGMCSLGAAALLYEWVHYLTHTNYRPRGRYYRWIWRTHRLHHFKNERYWFAFVGPIIDNLMGTAPDPAQVPTSQKCRDLDA